MSFRGFLEGTTDDRLTFLIHIPTHPDCDKSLSSFPSLWKPNSENVDNINLTILELISDNNSPFPTWNNPIFLSKLSFQLDFHEKMNFL